MVQDDVAKGESELETAFREIVNISRENPDGWVTGIYARLKDVGFHEAKTREITEQLVGEGRLLREGFGSQSKWKPVIANGDEEEIREDAGQASILSQEDEELEVILTPTPTPLASDEELIERIDWQIERFREEIRLLEQDRQIILESSNARARAIRLPPRD